MSGSVTSWPAYRFFRRQVRWSGIPISLRIFQFIVIHTMKGFSVVNEADAFLELSCFFRDPVDVGNLTSGSPAFSKSSLNIWKFSVHVLLKPDSDKVTEKGLNLSPPHRRLHHSGPTRDSRYKTLLFLSPGWPTRGWVKESLRKTGRIRGFLFGLHIYVSLGK